MTESEKGFLLVLDFHDELGDVFFRSDVFEHSNDCLIGTSVFGAVKGTRSHGHCGVDVDS